METDEERLLTEYDPDSSVKARRDALPKLDLDQNARVFIRLNALNQHAQSFQGEFLGTSHYEFLILRLPSVPGLINKLLPYSRVELRYIQEGAVHTFTTELISYSVKPTLLLFTTYPDRMSVMNTRKHYRVMCALPIVLHSSKGDAEGLVCDLSLGGCRLCLELTGQSDMRELAVGDSVALQAVFSADGRICASKAVVRNIEVAGSRMSAGLSFLDKDALFLSLLERYIQAVHSLA